MNRIYMETERLYVRQWEASDAKALHRIMSDRGMHAFTDDTPWSYERTERYIDFMRNNQLGTYAFLHGACVRSSDDVLIGLAGVNPYLPNCPEMTIQIGSEFQRQGYEAELGKDLITQVFLQTEIESVYCMVDLNNKFLMRTIEKIGMTYMGTHYFMGKPAVFYVSLRPSGIARFVFEQPPRNHAVRRDSA